MRPEVHPALASPHAPAPDAEQRFEVRAAAAVFGVGGLLSVVALIVGGLPPAAAPVPWINAVLSFGATACLLLVGTRLPRGWPHAAAVVATLNVAVSVWTDRHGHSALEAGAIWYFVWIGLFVGYFSNGRQAAGHFAFIALALAAIIAHRPPASGASASWALVAGSVTVAGLIVRVQQRRLQAVLDREARAARTDPLTGLANRRALGERFAAEQDRAARSGRPFAIVAADLDHFKAVNDQFGHHVGDQVLQTVGALLAGECRASDLPARLGGEEFALLLPDTGRDEATVVAERLSAAVRSAFAAGRTPVTISLGVAACGERDLDGALRDADEALYAAKSAGRDRVAVAGLFG